MSGTKRRLRRENKIAQAVAEKLLNPEPMGVITKGGLIEQINNSGNNVTYQALNMGDFDFFVNSLDADQQAMDDLIGIPQHMMK